MIEEMHFGDVSDIVSVSRPFDSLKPEGFISNQKLA